MAREYLSRRGMRYRIAKRYGLYAYIQFGRRVVSAVFEGGVWVTTFTDGDVIKSQFLVSAIGQLHVPKMPEIKGASDFQGVSFHSAKWNHDYDYAGKRIAVIGNAASAIQLIPELAEATDNLTVYHRTANWIIPKKDRAYWKIEKWLGKRIPALMVRYAMGEIRTSKAHQRPRAARENAARLSDRREADIAL